MNPKEIIDRIKEEIQFAESTDAGLDYIQGLNRAIEIVEELEGEE